MKRVETVIRWPDGATTPCVIERDEHSSEWTAFGTLRPIYEDRREHCKSQPPELIDAPRPASKMLRAAARQAALSFIAHDERLNARAVHTRSALISDIMQLCGVKRGTAKHLMSDARRMKRDRNK